MACNSSVGFAIIPGGTPGIFGYVKNLFVGTANVTIPGVGGESSSGKIAFTPTSSFQLDLVLADTLGVDLNFTLKNLTTSSSSSGTITAGNLTARTSGGVSFSAGDEMVVIVSLASGAQVIPYIQWDAH
jgi:hypothetical protein